MEQKDKQLKYIKYSDLTSMKEKATGTTCAITGIKLNYDNAVIDHCHITKKEIKNGCLGIDGKGLLRGAIINQVNVFVGKIENGWKRSGSHLLGLSLPDILRRIADYIENPPLVHEKIVHPKERPPKSELTKTEYNRICKHWSTMFPGKRTPPKYPKSKIKTPKWAQLLARANEIHFGKKDIKRVK